MAASDLFPYEEYIERYNVPRKGLPEAVKEAEEYRAKTRSCKAKLAATSPAQGAASPDSITVSKCNVSLAAISLLVCICLQRKRNTPGSSERGSKRRIKQEAPAEGESLQESESVQVREEESRDEDTQETHEQFGGTLIRPVLETEPHEEVEEKKCASEEYVPPPKRSRRVLKREGTVNKRQSAEAAGIGHVPGGEQGAIGRKEAISEPPAQREEEPTHVAVGNLGASQGPTCTTQAQLDSTNSNTTPSEGPTNSTTPSANSTTPSDGGNLQHTVRMTS